MSVHHLIDVFTNTNGRTCCVFLTSHPRDLVLQFPSRHITFLGFDREPLHAHEGDIVITTSASGSYQVVGCLCGAFTTHLYGGLRARDLLEEAHRNLILRKHHQAVQA